MTGHILYRSSGVAVAQGTASAAWYTDSAKGGALAVARFDKQSPASLRLAPLEQPAPAFSLSSAPSSGLAIAPDGSVVYAQGTQLFHVDAFSGVQQELDARDEPWPQDAPRIAPGTVAIPKITPNGRIILARWNTPGTFLAVIDPQQLGVAHTLVQTEQNTSLVHDLLPPTELLWYATYQGTQPALHVVDLATRRDLPVDLSPAGPSDSQVHFCGLTPDSQTLLVTTGQALLAVDLHPPAPDATHDPTRLLFQGRPYCDELSANGGRNMSPSGSVVFRDGFESTVVRWDQQSLEEAPFVLQLDGKSARYARFSPDGRALFAQSDEAPHRWYRWDARNPKAAPIALDGSEDVSTLVFDPSSRYLALPRAQDVRIYDLHSGAIRDVVGGPTVSLQWVQ